MQFNDRKCAKVIFGNISKSPELKRVSKNVHVMFARLNDQTVMTSTTYKFCLKCNGSNPRDLNSKRFLCDP